MKITLRSASVVFNLPPNCWAQTYCRNSLGMILKVERPEGNSLLPDQLGHQFIEKVIETVDETNFKEKFCDSLKEIDHEDSLSYALLHLTEERVLFLGKKTTIFLLRENKGAVLIEEEGTISGRLQAKDRLLLINREGIMGLGLEYFSQLLSNSLSADQAAENLLVKLHKEIISFPVVALLIYIEEPEEEKKETDQVLKPKFILAFLPRIKLPRLRLLRKLGRIVIPGLLLILLFKFFLSQGFLGRQTKKSIEQATESFKLAQHQYEEGKALLELNRLRAKDVLTESKASLEEIQKKLKKGQAEYGKVKNLILEVEKALEKAKAIYKIEPKVFFSLNLIRDKLTADELALDQNTLYLYNREKKLLIELNIKTKAGSVIAAGDDLKEGVSLTAGSGRQYLLTPKGVIMAGEKNQLVVENDKEWGKIVDIEYFGGSLYLFDAKGKIWKYLSLENGFSEKKNFLKKELFLTTPGSMAIDGSVWLSSDRAVLKFIAGQRDSFYTRGLEEPLGERFQIEKNSDLDNLYLLDKENKRIVVLAESGEYQGQYQWDKMGEVSDLAVSEAEKKIYLLVRDKIYTIDLPK